MRDEFTRLTDALGKTYEDENPTVAQTEIDEAVSAARRARPKRTQVPKKTKKR